MAATTLGFIPLQLIPTSAIGQYQFDKGFAASGTYVVVKTPTVAQQLQLTKSLKEIQNGGKEINNNNNENANNKPVLLRCKRRVDFTGLGCKMVDPGNPSVSRRNERERKRVKMVNLGFETLRQHVPVGRKNKKMSKVETLRSAVQYIKQLQEMLDNSDGTNMDDLLPSDVDMDALEDKVTEMIQKANDGNNNMELDNININNGLELSDQHNALTVNSANMNNANMNNVNSNDVMCDSLGARLQPTVTQQTTYSPESSPDVPHSPDQLQHPQHFFPTYNNHNNIYTTQYEPMTQASMTSQLAYSQASPEGSLHSPTSSIVSDSSYDSGNHEEEDYLNWFH